MERTGHWEILAGTAGVADCTHLLMMENSRAVNDATGGLVRRVQRP
jgi:hypothetical protein